MVERESGLGPTGAKSLLARSRESAGRFSRAGRKVFRQGTLRPFSVALYVRSRGKMGKIQRDGWPAGWRPRTRVGDFHGAWGWSRVVSIADATRECATRFHH